MSKLEVDAIEPQSGTTITIGAAGDTVNLIGTLQSNGSPLPGDISEVVAGTGLSGGGTTGAVTINIEAAQPTITSLGTITSFRSTGIDDNATSTAITIDSSENVGIGTASPTAMLELFKAGTTQIKNAYSSTKYSLFGRTGGNYYWSAYEGGANLIFSTSASDNATTEAMRIDSSGNLLLNTTSQVSSAKLSLNGSIGLDRTSTYNQQWLQYISHSGSSDYGTLHFSPLNGQTTAGFKIIDAANNNRFQIRGSGDSIKETVINQDGADFDFRVESDGQPYMLFVEGGTNRVGIGTSSPDTTLDVTSSATPTVIIQSSATTSQDAILKIKGCRTGAVTNNCQIIFETNDSQSGSEHLGFINAGKASNSNASFLTFGTTTSNGGTSTEKMRIDNSGSVGIGTTSPNSSAKLHIVEGSGTLPSMAPGDILTIQNNNDTSDNAGLTAISGTAGISYVQFGDSADKNIGALYYYHSDNSMRFLANASERMRIDSSGNTLINSTAVYDPQSYVAGGSKFLQVKSTATDRGSFLNLIGGGGGSSGYWLGAIYFAVNGQAYPGAEIRSLTGSSSTSGELRFHTSSNTTAEASERMRIDSAGRLLIGTTTTYSNNNAINIALNTTNSTSSPFPQGTVYRKLNFQGSNAVAIDFQNFAGSREGSIQFNESGTSFNTSSDYRLKENVDYTFDATTRLKQLKPARFNFIADDTKIVDGFIAHEVSSVVPEAISGEKDAMKTEEYEVTPSVLDEDGNVITEAVMGTREVPDYQGIDQSKLVPLLVKTIQELEARITQLENA
jgi:hypothetical protein